MWSVGGLALLTALATGVGALPFLFTRQVSRHRLGLANALAAGLMVAASLGLVYEGVRAGWAATTAGVAVGAVFVAASSRVLGHHHVEWGSLRGADARRALLLIGVMTIHSITEGVGLGVAFGGGERLGLLITLVIALHNVPEGLAISLSLVPRGASVREAAFWSVFSSLPQPLLAVPAFLAVRTFAPLLGAGLGFAAGAMLWMSARELVPEALEEAPARQVAAVMAASALIMLALQALLQA